MRSVTPQRWCPSCQASNQIWTLPPWAILTAHGEMASLGHGSSHPKVNAWCALMSSDPTSGEWDSWFLRMAMYPWWMDQWKRFAHSWGTSDYLKAASGQSKGTPHNDQLIPMSLSLIKKRSKTSSESLCDIWRCVILHCAPSMLPASGPGLGVL